MAYWWEDIKINAILPWELNRFPQNIISEYGNQLNFEGKFSRYLALYQHKNIPLHIIKQVLDKVDKTQTLFYNVCKPDFWPHLPIVNEDAIEALPVEGGFYRYIDWPKDPQKVEKGSEAARLYSTASSDVLAAARANYARALVGFNDFLIWAVTSRTWLVSEYGVVDRMVQLHRENGLLRKRLKVTEDRLLPYGYFKVIESAWKDGKTVKEVAKLLGSDGRYELSLAQIGALLSFKPRTQEGCKQWGFQLAKPTPASGEGYEWPQQRPGSDGKSAGTEGGAPGGHPMTEFNGDLELPTGWPTRRPED